MRLIVKGNIYQHKNGSLFQVIDIYFKSITEISSYEIKTLGSGSVFEREAKYFESLIKSRELNFINWKKI